MRYGILWVTVFYGLSYFQVYSRLIASVEAMSADASFSRDDRLGWKTFCPSNLGTAIRVTVRVMLPKTSARVDFKENVQQDELADSPLVSF